MTENISNTDTHTLVHVCLLEQLFCKQSKPYIYNVVLQFNDVLQLFLEKLQSFK